MNKDYLEQAIELSRKKMNEDKGGPFGAVIVYENRVIAEGWNEVTSSLDPTAHAEVTAIRKACEKLKTFELKGATLYSSCEPCPMCLAAVYWARIDRVVFANTRQQAKDIQFDDDFIYHEISLPIEARKLAMEHQPRETAQAVFREWEKKPDKIAY